MFQLNTLIPFFIILKSKKVILFTNICGSNHDLYIYILDLVATSLPTKTTNMVVKVMPQLTIFIKKLI